MTREDFCKFLETKGWEKDRFGHYKKLVTLLKGDEHYAVLHRFKLLKTCARLERKPFDNNKDLGWILLSREYYSLVKKNVEGTHYTFGGVRLKC